MSYKYKVGMQFEHEDIINQTHSIVTIETSRIDLGMPVYGCTVVDTLNPHRPYPCSYDDFFIESNMKLIPTFNVGDGLIYFAPCTVVQVDRAKQLYTLFAHGATSQFPFLSVEHSAIRVLPKGGNYTPVPIPVNATGKINLNDNTALCQVHDYVEYIGLMERYSYCKHCDHKSGIK